MNMRKLKKSVEPEVGMAVTYNCGSDSYPFTVIKVLSPNKIIVQSDNHLPTANCDYYSNQEYVYSPNKDGEKITLSYRCNGKWVEFGKTKQSFGFTLGQRKYYQDPAF